MQTPTAVLRCIVGLWDSLDAIGPEVPATPLKEQMDVLMEEARCVLERRLSPRDFRSEVDPVWALEALDGVADLVEFAYEHGFHEEGFDRPEMLRTLAKLFRELVVRQKGHK